MLTERDVLFQVLDALETLDIPYMIVGSFASNYWGRPRTTHDADLVIQMPVAKAHSLAQALQDEFYAPDFVIAEAAAKQSDFNVIHLKLAFKVDLWPLKRTAYDQECFRRRRQGRMFERSVWITSAEDTILSKLRWYQAAPVLDRQLQDALEVYEIQEPDLDQDYLNRWANALGVADLLARTRGQVAELQIQNRAGATN